MAPCILKPTGGVMSIRATPAVKVRLLILTPFVLDVEPRPGLGIEKMQILSRDGYVDDVPSLEM
jgi:hypothetical protein